MTPGMTLGRTTRKESIRIITTPQCSFFFKVAKRRRWMLCCSCCFDRRDLPRRKGRVPAGKKEVVRGFYRSAIETNRLHHGSQHGHKHSGRSFSSVLPKLRVFSPLLFLSRSPLNTTSSISLLYKAARQNNKHFDPILTTTGWTVSCKSRLLFCQSTR